MKKYSYLIIALFLISTIYLIFQSKSIYGGDAGELVSAIYTRGIPHPPGFPLYSLLGAIIIKIVPIGTIAWRISFLSSIPSIMSRFILFLFLFQVTKNVSLSLAGIMLYSFLYPNWLFAEIPEVMSLNLLFITLVIYFAFRYSQRHNEIYLRLFTIIFGLGFFHNYVITLILPGIITLIYDKKLMNSVKKNVLIYLVFFLLGMIPYIYLVFLSAKSPLLDYEHPASFSGLIKLMTRSSYGMFRLSLNQNFNPKLAIDNIVNLLNFIRVDFKYFGIVLFILGLIYLLKNNQKTFTFLFVNFVIMVIFFAYASFPLELDFSLGTYEKYLLMPYLYITIFAVFGIIFLLTSLKKLIQDQFLIYLTSKMLIISFFLYVFIIFRNNFSRISAITNDFTAENLGRDVLASIPTNGIVNLIGDTIHFDTLYVHHVLNERPDVKIITFKYLKDPYYRKRLSKQYPDLFLPDVKLDDEKMLFQFLEQNSKKYVILNNGPHPLVRETWLPNGLLWQYYPSDDKLPNSATLLNSNLKVWKLLHSPLAGSLSHYRSLLLSDVLRIYALGHQGLGMMFFMNTQYDSAENEFLTAINYWPNYIDNYLQLVKVYQESKKCDQGKKILTMADRIRPKNLKVYESFINLYTNCYKDKNRAKDYFKKYKKIKEERSKI